MKLIKQQTVYFCEGKSDKVYEVDLYETGSDLFLVNFRYGRRAAKLREGTKTIFPVVYEEALAIFDTLIASKVKKGYTSTIDIITEESPLVTINHPREETILKYLNDAINGNYTRNWKISKVINRASFLNIKASIPLIIPFVTSEDMFEQYAAITALSKFEDASAINKMQSVFESEGLENIAGRAAVAFLLRFGNESFSLKIKRNILDNLPQEIADCIVQNNDLFKVLSNYYLKEKNSTPTLLYQLYIYYYQDKKQQEIVMDLIRSLPLKAGMFKSIRYIYRAAEIVNDFEVLALISKKINLSNPGYKNHYFYIDEEYINIQLEKTVANPRIAFSLKTKEYFNKHMYSKVYDWSRNNKRDYVRYAVQLLCALDDEVDKVYVDSTYNYVYNTETRNYTSERRYFPKYHSFLALMYIIYGGSERLKRHKNKWYYIDKLPENESIREELLPELWNESPTEILEIIRKTNSEVALNFAFGVLKENKHFLAELSTEHVAELVLNKNDSVHELIVDFIKDSYKNTSLPVVILVALIKSKKETTVSLGMDYLQKYESHYLATKDSLISLIYCGEIRFINYLKGVFELKLSYQHEFTLQDLAPFLYSELPDIEYVVALNSLIGDSHFGELFQSVTGEEIIALSQKDGMVSKLFAANLSKHNKQPVYALFKDSFADYINNKEPLVRSAGIELVAHFPDSFLIENEGLIVGFCFSEHEEVRTAIQASIKKLILINKSFENRFFNRLIQSVVEVESYSGVHENSYQLLVHNYESALLTMSKENVIKLVLSSYESAQKLGTTYMDKSLTLSTLSMEELALLTCSDVLSVRNKIEAFFNANEKRVSFELEPSLKIFNSDWEDVIDWGCIFFENNIDSKYWSIDLLLYICDHTNKKVQAFGRKMITLNFSEDKATSFLLKLQEHPSSEMRFFVSNYLSTYASNNEAIILTLESYFKTSLFALNADRVTKKRIYLFLEQEAIKNKNIALMTVRILTSILGTNSIQDKSNNLDLLLTISEAHPTVKIPLTLKLN